MTVGVGVFLLPEGPEVSEDLMLMPNLVPQCQILKLQRADLDQQQF